LTLRRFAGPRRIIPERRDIANSAKPPQNPAAAKYVAHADEGVIMAGNISWRRTVRRDATYGATVENPFELSSDQERRAARVVASASTDATDCALLLAVLGLHPPRGHDARAD
jgi:hypothetical protein